MKIDDYKKIARYESESNALSHLDIYAKLRLIVRVRSEKDDDGVVNNNVICMKDFKNTDKNSINNIRDCLYNLSTFIIPNFGIFEYAIYYIDENGFCVVVSDFKEYHGIVF